MENRIAQITGYGPLVPAAHIKPECKKLAIALNCLLEEHFECIQEMYDTLGIDRDWIAGLWSGEIEPKINIYKFFISGWGVNPLFIWEDHPAPLIRQLEGADN